MTSLNDLDRCDEQQRIAVLGAGPIGIEAALAARAIGFDVTLFESGRIAENVRDWGHIRLFTPFGMNSSIRGRTEAAKYFGTAGTSASLPQVTDFLTGEEYAEQYLLPLAHSPLLAARVREQHRVLQISRSGCWKGEYIGKPQRRRYPFRLMLAHQDKENYFEADIVLDCTGTYPHHNEIGSGGLPALGERQLLQSEHYQLQDVSGSAREKYRGKQTLVIGAGYSAATAVHQLAALAAEVSRTQIYWLTRSAAEQPISQIEDDPLPARLQLTREVNQLALASAGPVQWQPNRIVNALRYDAASAQYIVELESGDGTSLEGAQQTIRVDEIIAHVGYRPQRGLYQELQIHECYASAGPIKLAAKLLGETSSDCLQQSSGGIETLCNPEPDYYILGAKSYGRDSRFLIKIGLEQIETVMRKLKSEIPSPTPAASCPQ